MNPIIWIITGAAVGLLTTILFHRRLSNLLLNIIVGMIGGFVAGFFLSPMLNLPIIPTQYFDPPAMFVSLVGAGLLLAFVHYLRWKDSVSDKAIERRWEQVRDKMHTRWGRFTTEDLARIDADHGELNDTIQARYECTDEEAEDQIQRYLKAVLAKYRDRFKFGRS